MEVVKPHEAVEDLGQLPQITVWVSPCSSPLLKCSFPQIRDSSFFTGSQGGLMIARGERVWSCGTCPWPCFSWPQEELVWGRRAHLAWRLVLLCKRATARYGWL